MPRPLVFSRLAGSSGLGSCAGSNPAPGIADGNHDLAGLAERDRALELLVRVAAAAMADGIRDRLLERELHGHHVLLGPAFLLQDMGHRR